RVVADPSTNSLLVRASPLDMIEVRKLITNELDVVNAEASRTYIIPVKFAVAAQVATVLSNVYREQTNNNPAPGQFGFGGGFAGFQNRNLGPDGNPRGVTLSIAVDDQTNSIIVQCSKAMKEDVEKLVDSLDKAAENSNRTVQVVPVKGIDP